MLSKNEVKYIQSLCHNKHRNAERVFVAEGPKLAEELLSGPFPIKRVYATAEWINAHSVQSVEITEVSNDELQKISNLQTANQVLVVASQRHATGQPVSGNKLTLVLDGIRDPGNLGTIIRLADWFGVDNIVASHDTADLFNPKVVQATMGSICRVSVEYLDLPSLIASLNLPVYGAVLNGSNLYETKPVRKGLLIIGNEGKGISPELLPFISVPVTIPKIGGAESLNAAVATGIILSYLKRS